MMRSSLPWKTREAAFKITDENNGLAKAVYQATLKLSLPCAIRRTGGLGMEWREAELRRPRPACAKPDLFHTGKFCVCVEGEYDV